MPRKALTLAAINQRLKDSYAGVSILQRGARLSLRGTFPPKPGSDRTQPHQQTISLGIMANSEGLRQAEAIALEIAGQLAGLSLHRLSATRLVPLPVFSPELIGIPSA